MEELERIACRLIIYVAYEVLRTFQTFRLILTFQCWCRLRLRTLTTDTTRQLNVLEHDGDSLSVDGAEVGVFKQTHQVVLRRRLLQRQDGCALEAQTRLEVVRDFTHQVLECQLADQQSCRPFGTCGSHAERPHEDGRAAAP